MTQSRGLVLIVDDEVFFREAINEILTGASFKTMLCENGESALERVENPAIGAVVLDVRLPDLDGIQVLACIREMRPDLPVIMLSSSTDQEIVLEALRLGANDYLAKPLHDEELVLAVGRALDGFELSAARIRLRSRIDRLVAGMENLSRVVRLADPDDRVSILRRGIVDSTAAVLEASRVSLMLADPAQELLTVVATCGTDMALETLSARKVGEGPSGMAYREQAVLCISDVAGDDRFAGRGMGVYESGAFAVIPLICLGVPVGTLCVSEGEDGEDLFLEETNILRLLGMQVSEFLAADPAVEGLLQHASQMDIEGVEAMPNWVADADTELARVVCEIVAEEAEPDRMLARALGAVASQLAAAPVSLYLLSPDGDQLTLETEVDGGLTADRPSLPVGIGLAGLAAQSGQLLAVEDPDSDPRFRADVDTAGDGETRPYLCVPLRLRNKVVGLLRVFMAPGATASSRTAEVLSATFSAALRNVLLYRSLLRSIEEVAEARRTSRGATG